MVYKHQGYMGGVARETVVKRKQKDTVSKSKTPTRKTKTPARLSGDAYTGFSRQLPRGIQGLHKFCKLLLSLNKFT